MDNDEQIHGIEAESSASNITPPPEFHYNYRKSIPDLAKLISVLHLPFDFNQKASPFIRFQQTYLNPDARPVPKDTLEKEVNKQFQKGMIELVELFRDFRNKVSLCIDISTDISENELYMSITCVWIDIDWNIQRRLIAVQLFDNIPQPTAHEFCRMVMLVLKKYRLMRKVLSICFDNDCSSFNSFVDIERLSGFLSRRDFLHIRRACYVINLCVQDGLKVLEMHFNPIKAALKYLYWDPKVFKEWLKFCKSSDSRPKCFPVDFQHRWDTTYEMLNESFEYKDLLCSFFASTTTRVDLFPHHWNGIDKILELLQVFYDANYNLSGVYYPTIHLFVQECVNIACIFSQFSCDDMLSDCVKAMKTKWCEFFINIPDMYLTAAVLDPSIRLDGLEECLNEYYQSLGDSPSSNVSEILINVRNNLNNLYIKYNEVVSKNRRKHTTSAKDGKSSSRFGEVKDILKELRRKKGPSSPMEELDTYLTMSFEFDETDCMDLDILQWWRQHEQQFPVLSAISKDIPACPISTVVPKEEIFSVERKQLSEIRCCMHPDSLEAHSCLGDWVLAEARGQEIKGYDNSELFEVHCTSDFTASDDDDDDDSD